MAIEATCTCGKRFSVAEKHAGKRGRCSKCGAVFVIPQLELTVDDVLAGLNEFPDMADSSLDDLLDESLPHRGEGPTYAATCPSCNAPMSPGALVCVSCGYHTRTGRRLNTVVEAATEPLPSLPEWITVKESGSKLVIKTPEWTPMFGFFIAILLTLLLVFAAYLLDSPLLLNASYHLGVFSLVVIIVLDVTLLNHRVIEVDSSRISIRTEGPLSWPNIGTKVAVDDITQLYVVERRRRIKGKNWELYEPRYHYTFDVTAVLKNGWRRRLVSLSSDRRGAEYIEKKIERFLSVKDVPVVSTWYQRWFLRESTLYDDREDFDPGTAISAKSMPLPTTAIFTLAILFTLAIVFVASFGGCWPNQDATNSPAEVKSSAEVNSPTETKSHQSARSAHLDEPVELTNSIGMKLKLIPAGTFMMGSPESEVGRFQNEIQHRVTLTKPYYLGTTEVTQGQWESVMGTTPWKGQEYVQEGINNAATSVNWDDAVEFCKRLSVKEGKDYRLPTEAEWEYACRAGTATAYSFGEDASQLSDYGWWGGILGNAKSEQYAHAVGLKRANAFGLYDMHGNVREWCSDWLGDYPSYSVTDPQGVTNGAYRVSRGGCWYLDAANCRSANRDTNAPSNRTSNSGFRLALSPSSQDR